MLFAQGEAAAFVGGTTNVIFLVCSIAGLTMTTFFYALFASHYFLVTVIDSTAGQDEVQYPEGETIVDWWWKPILCAWLVALWVIPGVVIIFPFLFHSTQSFLICLGLVLWFAFPLGVISTLYTQNWFFF